MKRTKRVLISCLLFSCAQGRANRLPVPADTTITAEFDLTHSSTFPQLPDSARRATGDLLAAADAPSCALTVFADTVRWSWSTTAFPSHYLRAVSLWLPPDLTPFPYKDTSVTEDSAVYWGHILGSWYGFHSSPDKLPVEFAMWIGPREGYPEASIGGDRVEQVAFSECRLGTTIGIVPVALFQVQSPSPQLSGYYVVAYWQIQPGVFVQASGSGPDLLSRARLLAALATIRVTR
jgi:hypothetical protein